MAESVLSIYTDTINKRLGELSEIDGADDTLKKAMYYSLSAGGKRLRPALNILANALLDGDMYETLDIACAIEMMHTYSLIHDDLPAMDDDEMRRGKPTSHKMFGEAYAILAGDGLLNYAFEVMLKNALRHTGNLEAHVKAMSEVAKGAGVTGMITGQCTDIENEGQMLTAEELDYTHRHKTGDMIKASLVSGLLLRQPGDAQVEALTTYGYNVGLTFQIVDDILDVIGDEATLGKSIGKDGKAKKFTYPTLYGIEGSKDIARKKTEEAVDALSIFGTRADRLKALAAEVLERNM